MGAGVIALTTLSGMAADAPISFRAEIAPVLQQKCVTCHNPDKAKGGYQLHTYRSLMKAGEGGEAPIVPGDPKRSHLYQLLVTTDADDRMPQKDDSLPASQLALFKRWIEEGARFDGLDEQAALTSLFAPAPHPEPPVSYSRPVPILALAFSPDGSQLAASGYHEVTVWIPTNGVLFRRLKPLPQQIQAIAFSPDGTQLAVAGGNPGRLGEVRLLDLKTGEARAPLASTADVLLALAFSPDGKRLVAGGADNVIRLFDVATGKEQRRIEQHADWVVSLAFNPAGTQFASASRDKTARLFDGQTGDLEETYDGHGEPVFAVGFSGDGQRVLSGARDKEIHAWSTNDARKVFEVRGSGGDVLRLIVHGDQMFSCSTDRQIRLHRITDKKADLVRTFSGHRDVVYSLAYHAPTKRLASGSFDGEVRIWDVESGSAVTNFLAAPGLETHGNQAAEK